MNYRMLLFCLMSVPLVTQAQTLYNLRADVESSYSGSALVVQDSSLYFFSGSRFGYDTKPVRYDSLNKLSYDNTAHTYGESEFTDQTFDAYNNVLTQRIREYVSGNWQNNWLVTNTFLSPSQKMGSQLRQKWNTTTNVYDNFLNQIFVYTNAFAPDSIIIQQAVGSSWNTQTIETFIYDTNHNPLTEIDFYNPGSSFEARMRMISVYNTNNQPIKTTHYQWNTSTLAWDTTARNLYTYDASGNLIKDSSSNWNAVAVAWKNQGRVIYTYAGTDMITRTEENWNGVTLAFDKVNKDSNAYDASHNNITDITMGWDNVANMFVNGTRIRRTYLANGQLSVQTADTWDAVAANWHFATNDHESRYYYDVPVSVQNTNTAMAELKLYPSPARSLLHYDITGVNEGSLICSVTGLQGTLLLQWRENGGQQLHRNISVTSLPAGEYIFNVRNSTTAYTKRFTIVK